MQGLDVIQKNGNIEILQVHNGFVVMNGHDYSRNGCVTPNDNMQVFQSFAELVQWLSEHFNHRSSNMRADGIDA